MVLLHQFTLRSCHCAFHYLLFHLANEGPQAIVHAQGTAQVLGSRGYRRLPARCHLPTTCISLGRFQIPLERWPDHRTLRRLRCTATRLCRYPEMEGRTGHCSSASAPEPERCGLRLVLCMLGRLVLHLDLLRKLRRERPV